MGLDAICRVSSVGALTNEALNSSSKVGGTKLRRRPTTANVVGMFGRPADTGLDTVRHYVHCGRYVPNAVNLCEFLVENKL